MIEVFKRFFTDPTFFARACKAIAYGGAVAVGTGQIPGLPPWVGPLMAGVGAVIKTGDQNPEPIRNLTPEELDRLRRFVQG